MKRRVSVPFVSLDCNQVFERVEMSHSEATPKLSAADFRQFVAEINSGKCAALRSKLQDSINRFNRIDIPE